MASPDPLMSPTKVPLMDEKGLNTPASKSSEESPPSTPGRYASKNRMRGALLSVLWGAFGPCIPVVAVTSILLTAVLHNRIPIEYVFLPAQPTQLSNQGLTTLHGLQQIENNGGNSAYYLYHNSFTNPAVLHMISSWTAKLMPFILGASMALVGFFAGQSIIDATRTNSEKLPTPRQTSILISLIDASGILPLWDTILYRRHSKEPLIRPVRVAFWSLTFIIFMTFVIGAADSWFGTAVNAVQISLVTPLNSSTKSFGRNLDQSRCAPGSWETRSCPSNPQALCRWPCSMASWNASGRQREGLYHAQEAAETLMSNSKSNTILNFTDDNGSNLFFLGDLQGSANLDFAAEALAVKTQCQVLTANCTVSSGSFTCGSYSSPSFSFSGEVGVDPANATSAPDEATVGIQFFRDAALTQAVGLGSNSTDLFSAQNPIHFLSWSKGFPPVDTYADEFAYMRGKGYLKNDTDGDAVFILSCSATIYQAEYYWVNGSVSPKELATYEIAPDYYGAVYSAPFATNSALSHLALQDAAALAAYQLQPETMSNLFADYFSRAAVAFSSGISRPVQNTKEWKRDNNYLATRVPIAPLYTLIALKAVYAVFALALALLAVFKTHPSQAQEVKARLTVDGLAAGFFEPHSNHEVAVKDVADLFQEHQGMGRDTRKIGLLQTDQGGWLWVTVGQKNVQGLGIHDTMQPVADQAPTGVVAQQRPRKDLGDRYTLVKDTV